MLTERDVRRSQPHATKSRHLYDQGGLYVLVVPRGSRLWRWDYTFRDREGRVVRKGLSFGKYPIVTLARAREKQEVAQRLLARGIDPSAERKRLKLAYRVTFGEVAAEWLAKRTAVRAPNTIAKLTGILNTYLLPALGQHSIFGLAPIDVLAPLRRLEDRGLIDTAHTARTLVSMICRYAVATGRAERDVTRDLRRALTPIRARHHPAVTAPREIGRLLRAIDGWTGSPIIGAALRLLPYVFVRPGELRHAEWREFDVQNALWRIPAARMKMRREHLVPLAHQAVAILRALQPITGDGRLLFPHRRGRRQAPTHDRPIADPALGTVLRRLGYGGVQTAHGFRTIASTRLREIGWSGDLVELQLAHVDANAVRAAYDRSVQLERRRAMMQAYADHLDALRDALK